MSSPRKSPDELIEQHQGLVRSLAVRIRRTTPESIDLDDLVGYGQQGLIEAARSFDAARGSQFSTYAYYRIRGAIYDGLSKMNWLSRSQYRTIRNQQMAAETLAVDADDTPSGKLQDEVQWLKQASSALGAVFLMNLRSDDDGDEAAALVDPGSPSPAAAVALQETSERIRQLIEELPSEAAQLIRAVYFDGMNLQEAGKQIGVSKAWASRLHARSLEQLGRGLRRSGISDSD